MKHSASFDGLEEAAVDSWRWPTSESDCLRIIVPLQNAERICRHQISSRAHYDAICTCTLSSKLLSPNSEGPCFMSETSPCMVDGSMLVQRFVDELPIVSRFPTQEPLINLLRSTRELPRILQWPNRKQPIILCFPTQGLSINSK